MILIKIPGLSQDVTAHNVETPIAILLNGLVAKLLFNNHVYIHRPRLFSTLLRETSVVVGVNAERHTAAFTEKKEAACLVLNKMSFSRKPLPIVTTTTQGTSQKRSKSQVKERSSVKCTFGPHVINSIMNSQQSAHDVHKINLAQIPGSTIGSGWLPGKERPQPLIYFS